ncbi:hypothetical protein [Methylocystis heyeri]|uniref:SH3 domain-containing protein n=1 Tax=Methylocystis heyeri TaxID=391905 RepID=A0A6B8KDT2_9HYPH|nr:hypothetical protein [Methylocystis heyeri]QGM45859.1 hypothetical protein H2LOC_009170 [Methylocystis heyeri]
MPPRIISVLAGAVLAASATSAFAFEAMTPQARAMRTHPSPRAAVVGVIPPNATFDMERCVRGWCEAAYAGRVGFVYTPVIVSGGPGAATGFGPFDLLTAPFTAVGSAFGSAAEAAPPPEGPPVVATY